MSKIKNGGLDQYGAEPFEQLQFGTSGVEKVKPMSDDRFYRPVLSPDFLGEIRTKFNC